MSKKQMLICVKTLVLSPTSCFIILICAYGAPAAVQKQQWFVL